MVIAHQWSLGGRPDVRLLGATARAYDRLFDLPAGVLRLVAHGTSGKLKR